MPPRRARAPPTQQEIAQSLYDVIRQTRKDRGQRTSDIKPTNKDVKSLVKFIVTSEPTVITPTFRLIREIALKEHTKYTVLMYDSGSRNRNGTQTTWVYRQLQAIEPTVNDFVLERVIESAKTVASQQGADAAKIAAVGDKIPSAEAQPIIDAVKAEVKAQVAANPDDPALFPSAALGPAAAGVGPAAAAAFAAQNREDQNQDVGVTPEEDTNEEEKEEDPGDVTGGRRHRRKTRRGKDKKRRSTMRRKSIRH